MRSDIRPTRRCGQLRHLLYKFWEQRSRKSQSAAVRLGSPAHSKLLHPGKRQYPGNVARLQVKDEGLAAEFAPPLKLPLKNHKHRIRRIALARVYVPRLQMHLLRLADEPVESDHRANRRMQEREVVPIFRPFRPCSNIDG